MATLLYQGHASCRITTREGAVIYIDPHTGGGYGPLADLVLITHEHWDHNSLELVRQKPGCTVIRAADALTNGIYHSFHAAGVHIEALPAGNQKHSLEECVGYLLTLDGVTLYHCGDTAELPHMAALSARKLDWVLLPVDGIYTMGPEEASRCARLIGARHAIPIHTSLELTYDRTQANQLNYPGKVLLFHGESVEL